MIDDQLAGLDTSPIKGQRSEGSFGYSPMQKASTGHKLAPMQSTNKRKTNVGHTGAGYRPEKPGDAAKELPLSPEMRISLILEKKGYKPVESTLPKKITEVADS